MSFGAEVDLGGAAGAFDEDEVGGGGEGGEAVEDRGEELGLQRAVVAGAGGGEAAALDDDLGAGVGFGLQQHRVHVDRGRAAGGAGLQRLGAADLAAVGGDGGVVGHVLRLERGDGEAAGAGGAAEAGDEERLADAGAGALEHQGGGGRSCVIGGEPGREARLLWSSIGYGAEKPAEGEGGSAETKA